MIVELIIIIGLTGLSVYLWVLVHLAKKYGW
jgi:hypothetical protein